LISIKPLAAKFGRFAERLDSWKGVLRLERMASRFLPVSADTTNGYALLGQECFLTLANGIYRCAGHTDVIKF
jgi:hypothetical protein